MYNKEKTIVYSDIGEVTIRKSVRAKMLRINVDREGKVTVTIPERCTWAKANDMIKDYKEWIIKNKKKMAELPPQKHKRYTPTPEEDQILAQQAIEYIPRRIQELAKQHNLKFRQLKLGRALSRWGCCKTNNDIIISIYTMRLPKHLVDFILLHELTHTIHKNHQAGFHAKLNEMCNGMEKQYDKEIREFIRNNS